MNQCNDCPTFKKADNCIQCANEAKESEKNEASKNYDLIKKYNDLESKYYTLENLIEQVKEETEELKSIAESNDFSGRITKAIESLKELINAKEK